MESKKHSVLGIVSFSLSIVSAVSMIIILVIAGVVESQTPGGMDEESTTAALIGLAMFAFLAGSIIALGLGIGSLFLKDRQKVFGILGAAFSALTIAGTIFIIILGVSMG